MIDHIKLAYALAELVQADLVALEAWGDLTSAVAIEGALDRLEHIRHALHHAVSACCAHCAEDMGTYTDGRAVASHLRFGDGTQYKYAWHPDAGHQMNRPHEIATVATRNGTRNRIHVAAPGILDAVSDYPGCESPSWAADW